MHTRWVRLALDVATWDHEAFAGVVDRCRRDGVEFTTMTEVGDAEPDQRWLYELNRMCSADIPERGEFYTYEEYVADRFETTTYNPDAVVLALDGEEWIGLSTASDHASRGYYFNGMTGVLRSHRRRGIALAMKVLLIEQARRAGVSTMFTIHHPDNAAPIALNRRLGYLDVDLVPRVSHDGAVAIRPPREGDAAILIAGRDAEFHRFMGDGADVPAPVACIWVGGEIVGWVDYDTDRSWLEPSEVNVGYNVFAPHRGNGYATSAVELLMLHLARDTDYDAATLLIAPDNERSLALARRMAFTAAGDLDGNPYFKKAVSAS